MGPQGGQREGPTVVAAPPQLSRAAHPAGRRVNRAQSYRARRPGLSLFSLYPLPLGVLTAHPRLWAWKHTWRSATDQVMSALSLGGHRVCKHTYE